MELGKSFYTTAVNRMVREIRKDAVLDKDIIAMLGGSSYNESGQSNCRNDIIKRFNRVADGFNTWNVNSVFLVVFA